MSVAVMCQCACGCEVSGVSVRSNRSKTPLLSTNIFSFMLFCDFGKEMKHL